VPSFCRQSSCRRSSPQALQGFWRQSGVYSPLIDSWYSLLKKAGLKLIVYKIGLEIMRDGKIAALEVGYTPLSEKTTPI